MGLFKLNKKKVFLGKWNKKLEIYIPNYDLEIKAYYLPFRIGSSPNNDLVLQEDNVDLFQCVILESEGSLYLFNISPKQPILLKDGVINSFESVQIEKSIQLTLGKVQLSLMPEKIGKRSFLRRKKHTNIQCPYCGTVFDIKKGCPVCGFAKNRMEVEKSVARYSKILKRKEERVESPTIQAKFGGIKGVKISFILENGPNKGKVIKIPENSSEITIGRSIYNAVSLSFLNDLTMSRFHCKLFIEENKVSILDNKSLNGTILNGRIIRNRTELHSGDLIQIGNSVVRIRISK